MGELRQLRRLVALGASSRLGLKVPLSAGDVPAEAWSPAFVPRSASREEVTVGHPFQKATRPTRASTCRLRGAGVSALEASDGFTLFPSGVSQKWSLPLLPAFPTVHTRGPVKDPLHICLLSSQAGYKISALGHPLCVRPFSAWPSSSTLRKTQGIPFLLSSEARVDAQRGSLATSRVDRSYSSSAVTAMPAPSRATTPLPASAPVPFLPWRWSLGVPVRASHVEVVDGNVDRALKQLKKRVREEKVVTLARARQKCWKGFELKRLKAKETFLRRKQKEYKAMLAWIMEQKKRGF